MRKYIINGREYVAHSTARKFENKVNKIGEAVFDLLEHLTAAADIPDQLLLLIEEAQSDLASVSDWARFAMIDRDAIREAEAQAIVASKLPPLPAGIVPPPPPAPPAPRMTAKAFGATYQQFRDAGWTDQMLIANGYMLPPPNKSLSPFTRLIVAAAKQQVSAPDVIATAKRHGVTIAAPADLREYNMETVEAIAGELGV